MIDLDRFSVQSEFFSQIRANLPSNIVLVDAIADVLSLSNDSAYRRIRGDKPISFDEIGKLSRHFKVSVDRLLNLKADSYIFSGKLANAHDHVLDKWLENVLSQFEFMCSYRDCKLYYLAKDLPLAHFFQTPELAAFKFFFWQKSILQYEEKRGEKFEIAQIDAGCKRLSEKIVETYNKIPTIEIWNAESINSTIRQIEFYRDAEMFYSKKELFLLWDMMEELVNHLERQSEYGVKFAYGSTDPKGSAPYQIYNNELILGNNTALADFGSFKLTFLNHSVINYISTQDIRFNDYMFSGIENMIRKSEQLNDVNEKGRIKFFNRLRSKIQRARKAS
ncbi:helix-turn-helix domain-containing protein [Dyadobacter sp. NIV53]|uniref:helix-turn-helix domain-containing protein n=1 Tax=Dyadobacter sp. NIV53 TaxID=2861765 RepID=UPI001C885690|nr:helix-turn-helix domain-containing protein [Dyadobacter sp. NIV53]